LIKNNGNKNITKIKQKPIKKTIKIVMKENKELKKETYLKPEFNQHRKCSIRSGFLAIVKKFNPFKKLIEAVPIYSILNIHTLSLFRSTSPQSSFLSVKLDKIALITQKYENTSCFDIKENNIEGVTIKKSIFTLCAQSLKEMNKWINDISDFKECQINLRLGKTQNINGKIIADFNKINSLTKNRQLKINKDKTQNAYNSATVPGKLANLQGLSKDLLKRLTYAGGPDCLKGGNGDSGNLLLRNEFEKLSEFIKMAEAEKARTTRVLWENYVSAHNIAEEVKKKKEKVKNAMTNLLDKSRKEDYNINKNNVAKREVKYFKQIADKIKEFTKGEMERYKKEFQEKINGERMKAKSEAQKLMKTIQGQSKNRPYTACLDKRLSEFKDLDYVHKKCMQYYGENVRYIILYFI